MNHLTSLSQTRFCSSRGDASDADEAASTSSARWPTPRPGVPRRRGGVGGLLWLSDVRALLRCPRCHAAPMAPPVRVCTAGHSICSACFEDLTSQPEVCAGCHEELKAGDCADEWCAEPPGCVLCGSALTETRNLLVESLIQMVARPAAPPRAVATLSIACTSPGASAASSPRSEAPTKDTDLRREPRSHRPIRCPKASCRSSVAVASLLSHFQFDHPEVPVVSAEGGARTTVALAPGAVPLEMARCVALLLVRRQPLPLMTARTRLLGAAAADEPPSDAALLVWLCDVDAASCSYSASAARGQTSAAFSGPVGSLRRPQTPHAALQAGDCLVLAPGLVAALSDHGRATVDVDVVVHSA